MSRYMISHKPIRATINSVDAFRSVRLMYCLCIVPDTDNTSNLTRESHVHYTCIQARSGSVLAINIRMSLSSIHMHS